MILKTCVILILIGSIMTLMDLFIPLAPALLLGMQEIIGLLVTMKVMGMAFIFIGIIVLGVRSFQTNAGLWLDLPSADTVICIHSGVSGKRLDPNAKFIKCKDIGLGLLKSEKKVFKDTGGGFRISGHDVRRTHEKVAVEIPEWLGQYLYLAKTKYLVENYEELKKTWDQLKKLHDNVPGMSIENQLDRIDLLKPVMKDTQKRNELLSMPLDDLKHMREYLVDGTSIHMEDVEKFIVSAKPNELDSWIDQAMYKARLEERRYRDPGDVQWGKFATSAGWFILIAVIGIIMLQSVFGG